jgi:hypothetical protein
MGIGWRSFDWEERAEEEELVTTMHKTRAVQPHDMWAWMSLFYTYYSLNGQTTLPKPLVNDRFPGFELDTVRDYFAKTPLDRLGRWCAGFGSAEGVSSHFRSGSKLPDGFLGCTTYLEHQIFSPKVASCAPYGPSRSHAINRQ